MLECEGLYDKDGSTLKFSEGTCVLKGYLYSLRNKKELKYELHDPSFAADRPARIDRGSLWPDWPVVYFPPDMLLHVKFHLAPAFSKTVRREKWYLLDKHEHEAITVAARASTRAE